MGQMSPEALAASTTSVRNRPPASGMKGVRFIEKSARWGARIKINGNEKHIGTFASSEEAASAYDAAAYAAWGDDYYLNFPRQKLSA
ncbi:MAG: AP2 domain-containing protein [Ferrovibrio sp.]|uniref:AP2 domain-containing protein n=1 Tax=Ferrovibrio sp. TaxID=1917215 RepID=UPI00261B4599|nr:AP2 domain-containing protein [Ferrovibrio sp.]MCW0235276.1 AP2 domain-containing protein [Ferrovibrio sp.]